MVAKLSLQCLICVLFCVIHSVAETQKQETSECPPDWFGDTSCKPPWLYAATGAVVGAVAAPIIAPAVLGVVGFKAAGIAAGIAAGSLAAGLQSVGMVGLGKTAVVISAAIGCGVGMKAAPGRYCAATEPTSPWGRFRNWFEGDNTCPVDTSCPVDTAHTTQDDTTPTAQDDWVRWVYARLPEEAQTASKSSSLSEESVRDTVNAATAAGKEGAKWAIRNVAAVFEDVVRWAEAES
eukprot:Selendium_serpulae@DN4809_c0_g1_i1.p1